MQKIHQKIHQCSFFWKKVKIDLFFLFLDPRLLPAGPMNSGLSVHTFVRPYICNAVFSGLAHYFFLIFCMKLRFNKYLKVTEPIFWGKLLLCPKWGKWGIFGPKINIFGIFSKSVHYFFLIFCMKLKLNKHFKVT